MSPSNTVDAQSGSRPTIERTFSRIDWPFGQPQQVVEEPVLLVPHLVVMLAHAVHRVRDPHEVLDELERDLLVHWVVLRQDQRHVQHALAVERHPRRPVRLLQRSARRQLRAAIEDPDVVEAEETAGEDVATGRVLAVHPPVEVQHQALERALEEANVGAAEVPLHPIEVQRRPGVHRRVDVAEVPLVRGNLAVRMDVEVPQHQQQLLFGEIEIHQRQRRRCGTPDPTPRTTGTPTCPAWRSRRR